MQCSFTAVGKTRKFRCLNKESPIKLTCNLFRRGTVYYINGGNPMKKSFFIVAFLIGFILMGCSNGELSGEKPPNTLIGIGNDTYETVLGTYCWKNACADTAGPIELLEGKEPVKVKPGEIISIVMDYEPQPNEFHIEQISGNVETEIVVTNNRFTAPTQNGIYYYSYGVWWMDEKEENLSNGDAFYAFVLEVE